MRRRLLLVGAGGLSAGVAAQAVGVRAVPELRIGQSAPLSGLLGTQIRAFNGGAELVFDKVNAGGGIAGRRLKFIALDDEFQPTRTLENADRLVNTHEVAALLGFVGSANLAAVDAFSRKVGMPIIGAPAVSDAVRRKTEGSAFYVRSGYALEVARIVQQLSMIGVRRVGLAHWAFPGGEEVKAAFLARMAALGMEPAGIAGVRADGSDTVEAAEKIAAARPQSVVMFVSGSIPARLIDHLDRLRLTPSFYGMSVVSGEMTAQALEGRLRGLVISQVVPYPWMRGSTGIDEFRRLAAASGVAVNYSAFEGYIAALVLVDALRRVGNGDPRRLLAQAMVTVRGTFAGLDVDFTAGGNTGSRFVDLVHIGSAGKFSR